MKLFLILFGILVCFLSCSKANEYFGLPNDHIFEEAIEHVIENEIGIKVDLTP